MVEVKKDGIRIQQEEEEGLFRIGTLRPNPTTALRVFAKAVDLSGPIYNYAIGSAVKFGTHVPEGLSEHIPVVNQVELDSDVFYSNMKLASTSALTDTTSGLGPQMEIGGVPGKSVLPCFRACDFHKLLWPQDRGGRTPIEPAVSIAGRWYEDEYGKLDETQRAVPTHHVVIGHKFFGVMQSDLGSRYTILVNTVSMSFSRAGVDDWVLAGERTAYRQEMYTGLANYKVIVLQRLDDKSDEQNWLEINSFPPLADWRFKYLRLLAFFGSKCQFHKSNGKAESCQGSEGESWAWTGRSLERFRLAGYVLWPKRGPMKLEIIDADPTGNLSEVDLSWRSDHTFHVAFPDGGEGTPEQAWSARACPKIRARHTRRHRVSGYSIRVLTFDKIEDAVSTEKTMREAALAGWRKGQLMAWTGM